MAELLLRNGADIELASKSNGGTTPLLISSYNGHAEVVELLLKRGADVTKT